MNYVQIALLLTLHCILCRSKTPLIIGHRGASGERPEESTAAFAKAYTDTADFIECDVQITRDLTPICAHSIDLGSIASLEPLGSNVSARRRSMLANLRNVYAVPDFDLREIRLLRLRRMANDPRNKAFDNIFGFVTLREFADYVAALKNATGDPRNVGIYVESKTPHLYETEFGIDMEKLIVEELQFAGWFPSSANRRVIYESFEADSLQKFRQELNVTSQLVQLIGVDEARDWIRDDISRTAQSDASPETLKVNATDIELALSAISIYADGVGVDKKLLLNKDFGETFQFVDVATKNELFTHVWTLRKESIFYDTKRFASFEEEVKSIMDLGVSGIFSDNPKEVRSAFNKWIKSEGEVTVEIPKLRTPMEWMIFATLVSGLLTCCCAALCWVVARRGSAFRQSSIEKA